MITKEKIKNPKAIYSEKDLKDIPLDQNLFIESSAGTGKTFTLENLYARLLKERNLSLNEILVVTFTEAAGGELKERIQEKLKEDKSLISHFHESQIFTIHGFSQKILRDYASFFKIPDNFSLITHEGDLNKLKNEAMHSFFRSYQKEIKENELYLKGYESLLSLSASLKGFNNIKKFLFPYLTEKKIQSLEDFLKEEEATSLRNLWERKEEANLFSLIKEWQELLRIFFDREEIADSLNGRTSGKAKEAFLILKRCNNPQSLWKTLDQLTIPKVSSPKKLEDKTFHLLHTLIQFSFNMEYYESAKSLSKKLLKEKEELEKISVKIKESLPPCLWEEPYPSEEMSPLSLFLAWNFSYLALKMSYQELENIKKKKNLLSFDDLILLLFQKSQDLEEAQKEELKTLYKAILIDEFQDTDNYQWHIFSQIFLGEETTLMMIGDPKQAIYSFRGAEISSFYQAKNEMLSQEKTIPYYLPTCYRSEESLINSFNLVFKEIFKEEFKLFQRDSFEEVLFHKKDDHLFEEINPINLLVGEEADKGSNLYKNFLFFLENLLSTKNISPKDCLILSRNRSELLDLLRISEKLKEEGKTSLSFSLIEDISLKEKEEYQETITFLKLLEHPSYYFSQLMLSSFFDLSLKEVTWLSQKEQEELKQKITGLLSEIYNDFSESENLWLLWVEIERLSLTTRKLVKELCPLLSPLREYQLINLGWEERLITQKKEESLFYYNQTLSWLSQEIQGLKTLNLFLKGVESGEKAIPKAQNFPDPSKIPLMSMHKSKGLEAPFVFILANKQFPSKKWSETNYSFYKKEEIKEDYLRLEKNKEKAILKLWQEEKNLLYVALTRAEKKIFILWDQKESSLMHKFLNILSLKPMTKEELALHLLGKNNFKQEDLIESKKIPACLKIINISYKTPFIQEPISEKEEELFFEKFPLDLKEIFTKSPSYSSFSYLTQGHTSSLDSEIIQNPQENLSSLPKGANLGNWIHFLIEKLPFAKAKKIGLEEWKKTILKKKEKETVENLFKESLKDHLFFIKDKEKTVEEAIFMLFNILQTPFLEGEKSLSEIETHKTIKEREFNLKVNVDESKKTLLENLGEWTIPLSSSLKSGFMVGILDCLIEHKGKLYILDWKTNFLGNNPSDYSPDKLRIAMQENNYDLQYHLYSLALKIWFKKYKPEICFQEIFGGAYYIFTRAFIQGESRENGIFFSKIPIETLELLEEFIFKGKENSHE